MPAAEAIRVNSIKGRAVEISVVGGGLAGLAFAALMAERGAQVVVYERSEELRLEGTGIFIWPAGVQILRMIVGDRLLDVGQPLEYLETYDRKGCFINSVSVRHEQSMLAPALVFKRSELLGLLAAKLGTSALQFCHDVVSIEDIDYRPTICFANGRKVECDLVVDACGAFSAIRAGLTRGGGRVKAPEYFGLAAARGLVDFDHNLLARDRAQIFTYDLSRIVTYPLKGGQNLRYWFAAYQLDGSMALLQKRGLLEHFSEIHPTLVEMIDATDVNDIVSNKLCSMSGGPVLSRGNVVLVGDSAHTMLPTLGYGLTLGLENIHVLVNCLISNCTGNIESALKRFTSKVEERSADMLTTMESISKLYYFEPEGKVTRETLLPIVARFNSLLDRTPM